MSLFNSVMIPIFASPQRYNHKRYNLQTNLLLLVSSLWISKLLSIVHGFDISLLRARRSSSVSLFSIDRRSAISFVGSTATGVFFAPKKSSAATDDSVKSSNPQVNDFSVDDFTFSIPSNWRVTSKPDPNNNNGGGKRNPKLFSAIDFQSGSVITVVREKTCNTQEYAQSINSCDILLPSGKLLFSEDTVAKDISKLLIRHDDRDNAVLQGSTKLESYDLNRNVLDLTATTTLPSGGTYRDTMGIDRPNTIDRRLKAKALVNHVVESNNSSDNDEQASVLTLWLSAPLDEWQKPVMGTKLNQVWASILIK